MRALGRVALAALSALALAMALVPALAVVMLGAPGLDRLTGEPETGRAAIASLQAAGIVLAIGWPAGVLAAFGIWGQRPPARRIVLGGALLALLLALTLSGRDPSIPMSAFVPSVAGAGSLVLFVVTGTLNTIDPRLVLAGAACGAGPAGAGLAILAAIRPTLGLAAAAAFSLGLALCAGVPHRPTLAGLLRQAIRQADVATAPEALILGMLSAAPLILAGLAILPGRAFRRV